MGELLLVRGRSSVSMRVPWGHASQTSENVQSKFHSHDRSDAAVGLLYGFQQKKSLDLLCRGSSTGDGPPGCGVDTGGPPFRIETGQVGKRK